jgi:hypothetical protein
MLSINLTILDLPKSQNFLYGKHWRVRHAHSLKWMRLVERALIEQERGALGLELAKATLTLTRFSDRELDFDNLCSTFKHPIDSLVKLKVIKDDKPSVIGSPIFLWQKAKRAESKITIKIEGEKNAL